MRIVRKRKFNRRKKLAEKLKFKLYTEPDYYFFSGSSVKIYRGDIYEGDYAIIRLLKIWGKIKNSFAHKGRVMRRGHIYKQFFLSTIVCCFRIFLCDFVDTATKENVLYGAILLS